MIKGWTNPLCNMELGKQIACILIVNVFMLISISHDTCLNSPDLIIQRSKGQIHIVERSTMDCFHLELCNFCNIYSEVEIGNKVMAHVIYN